VPVLEEHLDEHRFVGRGPPQHRISGRRPQTNGNAERLVRTSSIGVRIWPRHGHTFHTPTRAHAREVLNLRNTFHTATRAHAREVLNLWNFEVTCHAELIVSVRFPV